MFSYKRVMQLTVLARAIHFDLKVTKRTEYRT